MFDKAICWLNGQIIPAADARISVLDHGFLYGDGVFEGVRFYHKKTFRLAQHIQRLQHSAAALQLTFPVTETQLIAAIEQTIQASPLDDGYLRIIITRGVGVLGIDPQSCHHPALIIIADQLHMISNEQRKQGIKAIIASTRRSTPDRLDPRIKSLNYLNSILARMEANYARVEEAIMLNDRGNVAEGTADNVFIVQNQVLLTPPVSEGALAGITRQTILELAQQRGITTRETPLTPYDLYTADECFLSGTGAKLIPVKEIDGRKLRTCPGDTYQQLATAFTDLVKNEIAAC